MLKNDLLNLISSCLCFHFSIDFALFVLSIGVAKDKTLNIDAHFDFLKTENQNIQKSQNNHLFLSKKKHKKE